ncbi:CUB and sushi domain-containing protein 3-like isoform X2 [Amphiura filiformis]|uniref:CUB and sushi domain-containing protein 3-like isoform X2 n=1 Tax=Amphiura filiformis TaxID=82378 RepID=UPI003B20D793
MAADEGLRPFIWCMFFAGFLCLLLPRGICGQEGCPSEETRLSLYDSITISIRSPAYHIRCEWKIAPSATRRVYVQFLDFRTEPGNTFLYVGTITNPRALTYSGYVGIHVSDARIISPINESLLFEFTSDYSDTDQGFSLLVTDIEDGDYAICQNGLEIIQESFKCSGCPSEETRLSLNDSITISLQPAYHIRCEWKITASATRRVYVQILDFRIEPGNAILYVGTTTNPRALTYSGYVGIHVSDARIISPINESLLFEFTSDYSDTDQGFSLLVTDIEDGDYALCQNGLEIIQESFKCSGCPSEETRLSLNDSITISLQSPAYYIGCEWKITPSAMRRVYVQFLDFRTDPENAILYVGTTTNPRALPYSGYIGIHVPDARIISPINESLLFEFTSDYSDTDQGFSLLVTDIEDGDYAICQNSLEIIQESFNCYDCPRQETQLSLNASVIIQSPGYPRYYMDYIQCEWTVTPSPMRRILVQLLDFKLEKGYDFLYVGTINNPSVLTYSGRRGYETTDPRIISPIDEGLLFEFITDGSITDQGFSLLITDVENGDYALCQNGLEIIQESFNCSVCGEDEFGCADGQGCIPEESRCDYINDCGDNSDEVDGCVCDPSIEFNCTDGGCINSTWVCNGESDCIDGSDEAATLCVHITEIPTTASPGESC